MKNPVTTRGPAAGRSFRRRFTNDDGAIDLASIMVGVLVLGIVGGAISSTVFAVIPWAQDNAAKANLSSFRTAQSVAYVNHSAYLTTDELVQQGYLEGSDEVVAAAIEPASMMRTVSTFSQVEATAPGPSARTPFVATLNDSASCYVASIESATGKVFYISSGTTDVGSLEHDASSPVVPDCRDAEFPEIADILSEAEVAAACAQGPAPADANSEWVIPDENLRNAILYNLAKLPTDSLTVGDAESLTSLDGMTFNRITMLDDPDAEMAWMDAEMAWSELGFYGGPRVNDAQSLEGLERAVNLTDLDVGDNDGAKVDLTPVCGLDQLTHLTLRGSSADLRLVSGLSNLTSLDLTSSEVESLHAIAGLTGLEYLSVADTDLTDLSPIAGLVNLTGLALGTEFTDLSALSNMTKLDYLNIYESAATDISPLANLSLLRYLEMSGTKISDISALPANLETLVAYGTSITDWAPAAHVPYVYGRP